MKKILKHMNKIKKYFRRDNLNFVIKISGSILGFLITNFSLIQFNKLLHIEYIIALIFCVFFAFVFLQQIYYKYEYYHGLATQLQRSDKPLFLICSYISKSRARKNDKKSNDFTVEKVEIIYDIDVPAVFTPQESHVNISITYIISAKNNIHECSKVYHTVLSMSSDSIIEAYYKFDEDDWVRMKKDLYYENERNLTLWYGTKAGEKIQPFNPFEYSLRFNYKNGFALLKPNRFLIDPTNYGKKVNKINVVVRSKGEELKKIIDVPQITSYFNGINQYDRSAQSGLIEKNNQPEYKTYFAYDVEPDNDSLYILEISPIEGSNTQ